MFKLSLTSPELRLRVIKGNGLEGLRKPPPPIYPRFPEDKENVSMVECEQKRRYHHEIKLLIKMVLFYRKYKYQSSDSISNEENSRRVEECEGVTDSEHAEDREEDRVRVNERATWAWV